MPMTITLYCQGITVNASPEAILAPAVLSNNGVSSNDDLITACFIIPVQPSRQRSCAMFFFFFLLALVWG